MNSRLVLISISGILLGALFLQYKPLRILIDGVPLKEGGIVVGNVQYVPISVLAKNFGATVVPSKDGGTTLINQSKPVKAKLREAAGVMIPMNPDQLRKWLNDVETWRNRTIVIIELVNTDSRVNDAASLSSYIAAERRRLESVKQELSGMASDLAALKVSSYNLHVTLDVYDTIVDVCSELESAFNYVESVGMQRLPALPPSKEVMDALVRSIKEATKLKMDGLAHKMALIRWYEGAAGMPEW